MREQKSSGTLEWKELFEKWLSNCALGAKHLTSRNSLTNCILTW
jgi:hypothetical protein